MTQYPGRGQFLGRPPPDALSSRSRLASSSSRRFSWRSLSSSSRTVTLLAPVPFVAAGLGACVRDRGGTTGRVSQVAGGLGFIDLRIRAWLVWEEDARRRHRHPRRRTMTTTRCTRRMPPHRHRRTRQYRTLRRWRWARARRERRELRERGIPHSRTGCRSRPAPRWRSRSDPDASREEGTWACQRVRGNGSGWRERGEEAGRASPRRAASPG